MQVFWCRKNKSRWRECLENIGANLGSKSYLDRSNIPSSARVEGCAQRRGKLLLLHVCGFALAVHAAIVFFADKLQDFPGRMKFHLKFLAPWRREDFGIVDRSCVRNRRWVDVAQAFDEVQLIAVHA